MKKIEKTFPSRPRSDSKGVQDQPKRNWWKKRVEVQKHVQTRACKRYIARVEDGAHAREQAARGTGGCAVCSMGG